MNHLPRLAGTTLLLCGAALAPTPARAQSVLGRFVDAAKDAPIPGAVVTLKDSTGADVASTLTDEQGRFLLRAPSAGRYSLRAERIGFQSTTTALLSLASDATREIRLESSEQAVELEGVVATGERRCTVRPESALRTAALWEEARKALEAARLAERKRMLRYDVVEYQRELDPHKLAVRTEERARHSDYARHPFGAKLSAAELSRGGYIQQRGGTTYYYAPDPDVLLSDEFLGDHCFRVQTGDTLVGLAFEPVGGRKVPEIEGTMWLEPHSAELRTVEYRYTRLPYSVPGDEIGGRIQVERLSSGLHIISRWRIRMPVVELSNPRESRLPGGHFGFQRAELTGIHETGGEVAGVTAGDGSREFSQRTASLVGVAWDSAAAHALVGATVRLIGTSHEAKTSGDGRFRMTGLPEGVYLVSVQHPRLDSLGLVPPLQPIELVPGKETALRFGVPATIARADTSAGRIRVAGRSVGSGSSVTIDGRVTGLDGSPLVGAQAIVVLDPTIRQEIGALTDEDGRFRLSGVPAGAHSVAIRQIGYAAESLRLDVSAGESLEVNAALAPRPITIAAITVEGRPSSRVQTLAAGFEERRRRGNGFFIDRAMIQQRRAVTTSEVLELAPAITRRCNYSVDFANSCMIRFSSVENTVGILSNHPAPPSPFIPGKFSNAKPGTVYQMTAETGCPVQYYLDGLPYPVTEDNFEDIDLHIPPQMIETIEVYRPSEVPVAFAGGTGSRCGVVVIWTRSSLSKQG